MRGGSRLGPSLGVDGIFFHMKHAGWAVVVGMLLGGCTAVDGGGFEPCELEEPEVETVEATKVFVAGESGWVTAECPEDAHVIRGGCTLRAGDVEVAPMGAFGTDPIDFRGRMSIHAPQTDGWQCVGLAGAELELVAWVECRGAGGMDRP